MYATQIESAIIFRLTTSYKQVVKVIWHKAASPPDTDGCRIRQVAPMCTPYIESQKRT